MAPPHQPSEILSKKTKHHKRGTLKSTSSWAAAASSSAGIEKMEKKEAREEHVGPLARRKTQSHQQPRSEGSIPLKVLAKKE
jgi:hypothetical protein